jgi:phosphoglycerate dehydrogenase-like enzyme
VRRVLCLYPFKRATAEKLAGISPELAITFAGPDGQDAVNAITDERFDALLANFCPVDLRKVPALKWLATIGAGVDHLKAIDPWSQGVTVTNGSGLHGTAIAEYTMAAFLWFSQNQSDRGENQKQRLWPTAWTERWKELLGASLRGRTLTVVGYGSIGREVARLASAFGMRVVAIKARPALMKDPGFSLPGLGDPDGAIPARTGDLADVAEFFAESDFAVLTLPATPRTEKIIDRAAIAALPRHAVLVNVARGKILDEAALSDALSRGSLRGAVLDVAVTEPLPKDSPLWQVPNLVLTPHISAINDPVGWWDLVAVLMTENLRRYAAGRELMNVVNGAAGY